MKTNKKSKKKKDWANFEDWTTKKLKAYALELDDLIYGENYCYGVRDMITYSGICKELEKRKVVMNTKLSFD